MSWYFTLIKHVTQMFKPDERMVWIEISGLPLNAWNSKAFKKVAGIWGEPLFVDEDSYDNVAMGRVCIKSKIHGQISETCKVVIHDKAHSVWVKEFAGWVPDIKGMEDSSCNISEAGNSDNHDQEVNESQTSRASKSHSKSIKSQGSMIKAFISHIEMGNILGYDMEGSKNDLKKFIDSIGGNHDKCKAIAKLCNIHKVAFLGIQETHSIKIEPLKHQERCDSEIRDTVWDCGSDKSPGPDGFTFAFYKKFWDTIKKDVVGFVQDFFTSGSLPRGCNTSFIALIPKVSNPMVVSDFRPISLIGAQYKIIAKVLANRLAKVIDSVIGHEQSAFIKNRQILDGPLMVSEAIHWRLSKWKSSMLSIGGRATLISSVLGYIGTYYLSLFPILTTVNKKLESMRINNGASSRFWHETWVNNMPLRLQYPRLFHRAVNKNCLVQDCWRNGWSIEWSRPITGGANASNVTNLFSQLANFSLNDSDDVWSWEIGIETTFHTLWTCSLATTVWNHIFSWLQVTSPTLGNLLDLYSWIDDLHISSSKRSILDTICGVALWSLWSFRNETIFGSTLSKRCLLIDKIVESSFSWYSSRNNLCPITWNNWFQNPLEVSLL
nr:RNA-directed DNA polymerase, eukaryota, reverse transcriptase zinc-binding domain protein [Tanacetum cinerariifolium]